MSGKGYKLMRTTSLSGSGNAKGEGNVNSDHTNSVLQVETGSKMAERDSVLADRFGCGLLYSFCAVAFFVMGLVLFRRRRKKAPDEPLEPCCSPSKSSDILENTPEKQPDHLAKWPSPPAGREGLSAPWLEFVESRLAELSPLSNADDSKWALGIVDFIDELKESNADASSVERNESDSLCASLSAFLSSKGYSLIDDDEWNPEQQRAVAVVRKPDAGATKILGKGSTGLSRCGKIIRKQEVKVEMKGN